VTRRYAFIRRRASFGICPKCGVWIDRFGRCNCNSRFGR